MTADTVMPELDVFQLPVFRLADRFPLMPDEGLNELAADIAENGQQEPVVIAQIDSEWQLIDGRNRLAACKLAGVTPQYRVLDADPTAYVLSANVHRRHLTKGQQAMAVALAYPESKQGKKDKATSVFNTEVSSAYLNHARFVLRNCAEKAEEVLRNPHYPLTKAYEDVQAIVEQQRKDEEERKERERQLEELRAEFPDLAALFDDKRLGLRDALSAAQNRRDEAAEKARIEAEEAERIRREAEARLEEEERQRLEEERKREEIEKNIRLTLFESFNDLVTGSTVWAGLDLTKERIKLLHDPRFEQERMQWPALQKFDRKSLQKAINGLQAILEVYP